MKEKKHHIQPIRYLSALHRVGKNMETPNTISFLLGQGIIRLHLGLSGTAVRQRKQAKEGLPYLKTPLSSGSCKDHHVNSSTADRSLTWGLVVRQTGASWRACRGSGTPGRRPSGGCGRTWLLELGLCLLPTPEVNTQEMDDF